MHELGFIFTGLVVGVAIGATGVGGGSLMTPALILFYGVSPALAVGTDLFYSAISKTFAVVLHRRQGSVDWRLVGLQAVGSVPAVGLTLWLTRQYLDVASLGHVITLVLSVAIVVTAVFMLVQEPILRRLRAEPARTGLSPRWRRALTVLVGATVGGLVTVSSVGAGVIGLMLLMLLYPRQEPVCLVGSDLAHAVLVTALAGIGHAGTGSVDYAMLAALLVGSLPGIWLGAHAGFRLSDRTLKKSIAGVLIFVGATTLAHAALLA